MADNSRDVKLDPTFFLPPNVIDLRYEDPDDNDTNSENGEFDDGTVEDNSVTPIDDSTDVVWPTDTNQSTSLIPIPENITVVSQTVRVLSGGGYVVDVVFDVADLPGVETYDLSVVKV